jgi:hypothetical protein
MSKKGHKLKSKRKGSALQRGRGLGAQAITLADGGGVDAAVEAAAVMALQAPASPVVTDVTPPPPGVEAAPEVPENIAKPAPHPSQPRQRPRLETPIAFEAHRAPIATPAKCDAPAQSAESVESADSAESLVSHLDLDSEFFASDPHRHARADVHDVGEEPEERDPRMRLKLAPATAQRRERLQKYVKFAVGAASVLCLAALVKVAVARNDEAPLARRASASMQVAPLAVANAPNIDKAPQGGEPSPPVVAPSLAPAAPASAAPPALAPSAAEATDPAPPPPAASTGPAQTPLAAAADPSSPPPTAAPAADPASAPSAVAPVANPVADPGAAPEPDPKAAAKEKHASQLALERGKAADAIAAGERSVALDPTDAEAWLILGAAYQEKGDSAAARRTFKSCLEQGKRGPKWECAQMPH